MKRITVPFKVKQSGDEGDGFFHIRGLASTYQVDLGDDEIIPGAFADTIAESKMNAVSIDGTNFKALIPSLWQHNTDEPTGSYVEMVETQQGLEVHSIHPLEDDFVRGRVKPQVKVGSVRKMSIGYRAKQFSFREEGGRMIRTLEKIDLGEISLVTFPMNTGASITSAKSLSVFQDLPLAETDQAWEPEAAKGRVRQFSDSVESPSETYKNAFLFCDAGNSKNFDGYTLQIADVIDGHLKAIPKAMFAAAAAMRGANKGIAIHESSIKIVEAQIKSYYQKMDRESPLKENHLEIDNIDVKNLTERELEGMLSLESVKFTTQASKTMIGYLDVKALRDAGNSDARDAAKKETEQVEKKMDELITLMEIKNARN